LTTVYISSLICLKYHAFNFVYVSVHVYFLSEIKCFDILYTYSMVVV